MVSGISDVSALQVLRATQAFKNAIKSTLDTNSGEKIEDPEVMLSLSKESREAMSGQRINPVKTEENILSKKDEQISEIKDFANKYGITDIDNEDIDYAIRYGRSILVDRVG